MAYSGFYILQIINFVLDYKLYFMCSYNTSLLWYCSRSETQVHLFNWREATKDPFYPIYNNVINVKVKLLFVIVKKVKKKPNNHHKQNKPWIIHKTHLISANLLLPFILHPFSFYYLFKHFILNRLDITEYKMEQS